uniref:Uncharacterized protein n=1 Tax=Plectus sambesii TaxID=2011161 RepID=A0A914WWD6_9BILA
MVLVSAIILLIAFDGLHISLAQVQQTDTRNASLSPPLFDAHSCENSCTSDQDCPELATCRSIIKSDKSCGVCVCAVEYDAVNGTCVKRIVKELDSPVESLNQDKEKQAKKGNEELKASTKVDVLPAVTVAATEEPEWDCSKFDCESAFTDKENDDPLLIRTSKIRPLGENST